MCDAQSSDTEVRDELRVMNDKLDHVLKILGKMKYQNESSSKLFRSPWYKVTRLQSKLRKFPIFASKMKKLKQIKKKILKVDVLKLVMEKDEKLFNEWFDMKQNSPKNVLIGSFVSPLIVVYSSFFSNYVAPHLIYTFYNIQHEEKLLALMHVRNIKHPRLYSHSHVVIDLHLCNNMYTAWDKMKEDASKDSKDLNF